MRHSPGPWKMKPNGEVWSYCRGSSPKEVGAMTWACEPENRSGNQRLLCAAPDLLASIDELIMLLSHPTVVTAVEADEALLPKAKLIMETSCAAFEQAAGEKLPGWPKKHPRSDVLSV